MSGDGSKKTCVGADYVRNIGYIEDILAKILSKLPVNSVLNCKLVAKFWYRLISEPQFAKLHFSCSPKNPKYLVYFFGDDSDTKTNLYLMDRDDKISPNVTLPSLDQNSSLQLICSFNGLICSTKLVGSNDLEIQICNPATREVLEVPSGSPSAIAPSIGIIFDSDRNKYKVLRFFCDAFESEDSIYKCEMYTPDGGEWRRIAGVVQPPVANLACPFFPTHLCVGGRMYWLVWSKKDRETPDYILSIDMDENFTRIELPEIVKKSEEDFDEPNGYNLFTFLIEYEGRLALVRVEDGETWMEIWSLRNHIESSWLCEGSAELYVDGNIDGINSIVSIENELLFIIKPCFDEFYRFCFLNLAEETWREPKLSFTSDDSEDDHSVRHPVAFSFAESLFRCDTAN